MMDEPLSNLDAKLRVATRASLAQLHVRLRVTTVYVTHDQVEAMTLGERVAVMRDGRIQQIDTPQQLYRAPANLFVAAFIGSPSMNLIEAVVDGDSLELGQFRIPFDRSRRPSIARGGRVIVGIRPEDFEDAAFARPELPQIEVMVDVMEELGSDVHVIFPVDAAPVEADQVRAAVEQEETALLVDGLSLFNARVDPRTGARTRKPLRLAIDA